MRVGERRVHRVGEELAEHDHELVERHQGAAHARGRGLRQVDRHGRRGAPDRQAENETEQVQHPDVRCDGAPDRADDEHDGEQQDVVPPPVAVRQSPGADRPDRGADGEDAADQALLELVDSEPAGHARHVHVRQGARDDARVVAEEERSEGRDGGEEFHGARRARGRGLLREYAQFLVGGGSDRPRSPAHRSIVRQ